MELRKHYKGHKGEFEEEAIATLKRLANTLEEPEKDEPQETLEVRGYRADLDSWDKMDTPDYKAPDKGEPLFPKKKDQWAEWRRAKFGEEGDDTCEMCGEGRLTLGHAVEG